jgi:4-carboxymuconolactone decarboxylase
VLGELIAATPGFLLVGEAGSGVEAGRARASRICDRSGSESYGSAGTIDFSPSGPRATCPDHPMWAMRALERASIVTRMVAAHEQLLRQLMVTDESCVRAVIGLAPDPGDPSAANEAALTARVAALVRLAALFAVDAPTTSLRWAADLASCAGAVDEEIVGVLVTVGCDIGFARLVCAAPRLALAIGYDIEIDGWDGS